ncbi:MAG: hypothetical protein AVDCRST_MAG48-3300 [uncultured Friedmanniella sp.]|uniref:Uncharacterized protein n=1 Tax=uncultured Friedmanniella sp. TaxID=335381 RepID=A0A6J4LLV5_9ACTN|nr:MAG: hypothetical protein AVDCRST_MAG48-3300 [uncultured Friedmanniella sp.]
MTSAAERGDRGCGYLRAAAELTAVDGACAVVRAEKDGLGGLLSAGCPVVEGRDAAGDAAAEARQVAAALVAACR